MHVDLSIYPVASGTTDRYDCPVCGGINTFTITNDSGTLIFNCYRAGCNTKGSKHKGRTLEELAELNSKPKPKKVFKLPEYIIYGLCNDKMYTYLQRYHCISTLAMYSIAYDPRQDRLLFLIKDKEIVIGAVGRDLSGRSKLKSLIYHDDVSIPFIVGSSDTIVIVEDCASAASVARNPKYTGLALLGTNLKSSYIPYIKKYSKVIVALDKDANRKAIDMKKYLSYYCNDVSVWLLNQDIKDMENI